jgi:hypothetical protein
MKWIISLLLLIGCNHKPVKRYPLAPPATWQYMSFFEDKFGVSTKHIHVTFNSDSEMLLKGAIGVCSVHKRSIQLNKPYWDKASHIEKLVLVVHELGHCALLLTHTPDSNTLCSFSIMEPSGSNHECYKRNLDYYISEMNFIFDEMWYIYGYPFMRKPKRDLWNN